MVNGIIWIAAIVVFLIVETSTSALVSIWFAGGSLAALISHLLGASTKIQLLVFLLVSAVCVVLLRKAAVKNFKKGNYKTDLDRIVGQKVVISGASDNGRGSAFINDVEWKVKSENGENLFVGETVTVEKIEGVNLIVKK